MTAPVETSPGRAGGGTEAGGPAIVLGVTGGIAAYKAAEIVRALRRAGCAVTVVMTEHAREFITPLTLQVLSGRPVVTGPFDLSRGTDIEHIALVRDSALLVVAPATADILAKFAWGVADDFLSTFYTAYTGPVLVAPAMNARMWAHPTVEANLATLRGRGVGVVDPEAGELACGEEGMGRLADPERIAAEALRLARRSRSLAGQTLLVTAGPTREPLDPVRFLTNRSSGRMGYALAAAARRRGARVLLVSGPVSLGTPWGVERTDVETAAEMAAAVARLFPDCTACIMTAAVADYRAAAVSPTKLRRGDGPESVALVPTEDILAALASHPGRAGRLVAGFAAETGDPEDAARAKLARKGLDFIFGNDVSRPGEGFDVETNALVGLSRAGGRRVFPRAAKGELAAAILDWMEPAFPAPAGVASSARESAPGRTE